MSNAGLLPSRHTYTRRNLQAGNDKLTALKMHSARHRYRREDTSYIMSAKEAHNTNPSASEGREDGDPSIERTENTACTMHKAVVVRTATA